MESNTIPRELFPVPTPKAGTIIVNERVRFRTMEDARVVCVDGIILHHYRVGDRMAEAYAMVMLAEQGYADQNDIGRAFDYATRTIRRYQERFEEGGLQALGKSHGRQLGSRSVGDVDHLRDRTILRLKTEGSSNRVISRKVGLHEKTIRRGLRRLGWKAPDRQHVLFEEHFPAAIPQWAGSGLSRGVSGVPCQPPSTHSRCQSECQNGATWKRPPLEDFSIRFDVEGCLGDTGIEPVTPTV
jgi:transposase